MNVEANRGRNVSAPATVNDSAETLIETKLHFMSFNPDEEEEITNVVKKYAKKSSQ